MFKLAEEYIEALFRGIFLGQITQRNLPPMLYYAIADYLKKGVYKGYGIDFNSLTTKIATRTGNSLWSVKDLELLTEFRTNVYLFSAAKTYQQVRIMSSHLMDDSGKLTPFKEFREKAEQTYSLFNKTWLRTEYDTAIGQAQSGIAWRRIEAQADTLPLLKYDAVIDDRTSDICRPLDGIVAPVDDPIWRRIGPLNHFNCRCRLRQLPEGKETPKRTRNKKADKVEAEMDDLFKHNPGTSGYIFSKKHPYFDVAERDKGLARDNFNLKIPARDA